MHISIYNSNVPFLATSQQDPEILGGVCVLREWGMEGRGCPRQSGASPVAKRQEVKVKHA